MKYSNAIAVFILLFSAISCHRAANTDTDKPNVIIIFTDDQGYQDLSCYGSPLIKTPNIDKLAESGIRLTNYYVSNSVCSASRASLLTGKFPCRHGIGGAIFPEEGGLASKEVLLPELLKQANYNTACFGKWHLGDTPGLLPLDQGFDEYFGIPYSNDMYIAPNQKFASDAVFLDGYDLKKAQNDQDTVRVTKGFNNFKRKGLSGKVPLFEGAEVVEYPCNQKRLPNGIFNEQSILLRSQKTSHFLCTLLLPCRTYLCSHQKNLRGKANEVCMAM